MTRKGRGWLIGGCAIGLGVVAGFLSIPVVRADDPGTTFEIQVVLGGNTRERSTVSHELWLRHPTPILVTGDGEYIRNQLLRLGVPAAAMIHEPAALTTWQNAEFSVPMLRERQVKSAVIVTSWFHTARAHSCFTNAGGDIQFAVCADPLPARKSLDDWKVMTMERMKRIGYWIKYGMNPWATCN
jgi:uncharacterized SAM-binding protein YcdF (DUF218 family)